jgi:hypothetical protein
MNVTHKTPVPPDNRSPKGTGDAKPLKTEKLPPDAGTQNLKQQGQQANTKQNTTHQGYQQDR